jgi:hypothetical protein
VGQSLQKFDEYRTVALVYNILAWLIAIILGFEGAFRIAASLTRLLTFEAQKRQNNTSNPEPDAA